MNLTENYKVNENEFNIVTNIQIYNEYINNIIIFK